VHVGFDPAGAVQYLPKYESNVWFSSTMRTTWRMAGVPHWPWAQSCPAAQATPHPPQFAGSVLVSTHARPHCRAPAGQLVVQLSAAHTWSPGQTLPQVPQLSGSLDVSTQDRPHAAPVMHVAPQWPTPQTWVPGHALPHVPQLAGSVARSVQASPHFAVPPLQSTPHVPWVQLWPAAHALPQAPQLARSPLVAVHVDPHRVAPGMQVAESTTPASAPAMPSGVLAGAGPVVQPKAIARTAPDSAAILQVRGGRSRTALHCDVHATALQRGWIIRVPGAPSV
jgi:hypothetical protein